MTNKAMFKLVRNKKLYSICNDDGVVVGTVKKDKIGWMVYTVDNQPVFKACFPSPRAALAAYSTATSE